MKFIAILVFAFAAVCLAQDGPSKIDSNNIGDIVNVGVKARAHVNNQIDATLISILLKALNKQIIGINGPGIDGDFTLPTLPPNLPTRPPIEFPTPPPAK
ncbi:unnamed protein product [Chironomus riparius]|uniref:Uncharacterized protein n=1 Tax=Chironomus riparius TaxID=315576 RepID=A0A9N9WRV3_9DIPT|nr:unnamed protein product [Chironomus riparius]